MLAWTGSFQGMISEGWAALFINLAG
jgi:hypothetical protein